jgi:hypothetical protein
MFFVDERTGTGLVARTVVCMLPQYAHYLLFISHSTATVQFTVQVQVPSHTATHHQSKAKAGWVWVPWAAALGFWLVLSFCS